MPGLQEILILVIIILALFFIPRVMAKGRSRPAVRPRISLPGRARLAIAVSFFWPAIWAVYLQPWRKDFLPFIVIGLLPPAVAWILYWVLSGFKKKTG